MQYFYCIYLWEFVYLSVNFLSDQTSKLFIIIIYYNFGEASAVVTKCSILDVAGVLNPRYIQTWIAYTNNLIQVPDK